MREPFEPEGAAPSISAPTVVAALDLLAAAGRKFTKANRVMPVTVRQELALASRRSWQARRRKGCGRVIKPAQETDSAEARWRNAAGF
jgi:hypothetical protein